MVPLDIGFRINTSPVIWQAISAFFLASCDFKVILPTKPVPWWESFIGKEKENDIALITNLMLGMSSALDGSEFRNDMMLGLLGFVKPMQKDEDDITNNNFNGVGSFLWDHQSEVLETGL